MRVLIAGGGTGGHFYPGLAVAEALRQRGAEVFWLGAKRGIEVRKLPDLGIPFRAVNVTGFVGQHPVAKLLSLARFLPAVVASRRYLGLIQPHVVLSVGGYAALSGGLAAAMAGIPLVIQEQNALPGVVHRLLAPFSAAISCGFLQTLSYFPSLPAIFTGNPVRQAFFQLPPPPQRKALLVMGGSQGSSLLNELVPKALLLLAPEERPEVVHQSGEQWETTTRATYLELGIRATVVGYLAQPWELLAHVPLVVARAGALTVNELAAAGRAAIFIPFGRAAHDHQRINAQAMASLGAAWVLPENEATPEALAKLLANLFAELPTLLTAGSRGKTLVQEDATQQVVRLLYRAAGEPWRNAA